MFVAFFSFIHFSFYSILFIYITSQYYPVKWKTEFKKRFSSYSNTSLFPLHHYLDLPFMNIKSIYAYIEREIELKKKQRNFFTNWINLNTFWQRTEKCNECMHACVSLLITLFFNIVIHVILCMLMPFLNMNSLILPFYFSLVFLYDIYVWLL